ncbi:MAG: Re/Si-specific NAD(P)(+) transhydrogenase subunit alpha [Leptospirillia bacterium]
MKIGIPRETAAGENRVAATPETVKKAIGLGLEVIVESGAGNGAAITDDAYQAAGATLGDAAAVYGADIVFAVQTPSDDALNAMGKDSVLIGMLNPLSAPEKVADYARRGITAIAMEMLPRITRAQSMDTLSSQSNVAGYGAVLLAATAFPRLFPMMMTAAGTISPARLLVLGVGVAGLQAIATAKRLGAVVSAYDVRPAVREQVESLGAAFVAVDEEASAEAETAGGYAKEMDDDYKAREQEVLAAQVARADMVITTAQIPGKPAPRLVTTDMVKSMRPGSVIVDMAAETGGNCELTEPGEVVEKHGVILIGTTNLPSKWAADASELYARNLLTFLTPLVDQESGTLTLDAEDEIIAGCLLTRDGAVVHPNFKEA